jgi:hypothetical protein
MNEACSLEGHYRCRECSADSFYFEVIGYGVRQFAELDDEHRALDFEREVDKDPDTGWLGPKRCFVRCSGCDREIAFGWSHEDRGGRIWPVEATCFNPRKSVPEARYRKVWPR